jgi:arylsulfatase
MFYFNDDGSLVALRYNRWKLHFQIQEHHGFDVWQKGWTELRVPMLFDLQADPFERAQHDSEGYKTWAVERIYLLVPAQAYVGKFLMTFKDYPQRQKVGSFSLDRVLEALQKSSPKN